MEIRMVPVVAAAHAALKNQADRINALNVYPVPDGDTGTNMLLTAESVLKETANEPYASAEEASRAASRAALMGARGNSGVILSQMIRGACDALAAETSFSADAFAIALEGARDRAYASVREPVEGTMLTVIKDAAVAARSAEEEGLDLLSVSRAAAREAHESVRRTTDLLDVLRDAGVVDAGGLGVATVLDGIYAAFSGQEIEVSEADEAGEGPDLDAIHASEEQWGYCTEFLVVDFDGDAGAFEDHIHEVGRSVLVIPDDDVVKVHLHTQDPGDALSYAGSFGRLRGVKVDDMEDQVRERSAKGRPARLAGKVGVVAAVRGEGSRELFESMGAVVIEGGQGSNPSAADFARAVEETGMDAVILLPNNKNIVPTAEQVGELVKARVYVVPTTSIASGLAEMVGFDSEGDPEDVAEEMHEILAGLRCGEVTRAVRKARIGDLDVPEGAYMGLLDGELLAVEATVDAAAMRLVEKILEGGADIFTILRGAELGEAASLKLAEDIRSLGVEVEVRDGGQPMYPLQMVAE
ncbi:MAG: DAK2 domain-containing protein [Actinomycetota bacterium]|jgi:DAK2 domain fusion protein YloV|nr:DAK2 domain-containing protein [Actinomycetota bacterium]